MREIQKYLNMENSNEVSSWIKTTLVATIKKHGEPEQSEVEHILDFLNSPKAPKRLRKMSYAQAKEGAQKWLDSLAKKGANIVETEEDTEVIKIWKSGFRLVKLVGEAAFKREGHLMSHCVSSYYGKEGMEIYSIRDSKNMPHCTMELVVGENGRINQIKGKGNGSIHPKYISYVLKSLKRFGVEVRKSEMENLGYEALEPEFMDFLEKNFDGC